MKLFLTFLLSFLFLFSSAQSKLAQKSEKLYQKGKYEKCIEKSLKALKKERKSAELQYYIVASQLALCDEVPEKKKSYQLKKAINSWKRLCQYNLSKKDYSSLENKLSESIYKELNLDLSNQRLLDYYNHQLAEVFSDTTDYYRSLYEVASPGLVHADLGPVYDSTQLLNDKRRKLIGEATKVIGVKYKYGGSDSTGFDCSGFTQYVYQSVGIKLPHNAHLQSTMGETISLEEAQSGDLIFFGSEKRIGHAGMIYQNHHGEIELVHCASRGVTYQKSDDPNTIYWLQFVVRVQRLIHDKE